MKRKLCVLSVAMMLALAGCSGSGTSSDVAKNTTTDEQLTTVDETTKEVGFTKAEYDAAVEAYKILDDYLHNKVSAENATNDLKPLAENLRKSKNAKMYDLGEEARDVCTNIEAIIAEEDVEKNIDALKASRTLFEIKLDLEVEREIVTTEPTTTQPVTTTKKETTTEKPTTTTTRPTTTTAKPTTTEVQTTTEAPTTTSSISMGKKNALKKAGNYLDLMPFSYNGLIGQLEYEGFSKEECVYAADNCGANWNEQALAKAHSYLDLMPFSYSGLIKQLEYEEYTNEQAKYAVDNCGANWNEQAAKKAESYLELMAFSKQRLIEQLEYEGFTHEQAVYGAEAVGY